MKKEHTPSHIDVQAIRSACKLVAKVPKDLEVLNELRYYTIPQTLLRRKNDGDTFLEKTEIVSLVDWKLCVVCLPLQCLILT